MKYYLEWNQGSFESNDWLAITTHPQFFNSTTYLRTAIGLVAI